MVIIFEAVLDLTYVRPRPSGLETIAHNEGDLMFHFFRFVYVSINMDEDQRSIMGNNKCLIAGMKIRKTWISEQMWTSKFSMTNIVEE